MKIATASRIAQGIQLLNLDGYGDYTYRQLANVSGISVKTLQRNADIVVCLDFAINGERYRQCNINKMA